MRARRVWAGVAAAGLIAGLGIVGAAPASAQLPDGCDALNGRTGSDDPQVLWGGLLFQAGERLTITWSDLTVPSATVFLLIPGNVLVDDRLGAGSVTYLFPADTSDGGNSFPDAGTGTWSISCGFPTGTSDGSSAAVPVPAWVQAYGRTGADATCEDGWDASWQEWAEPVTGGWVCTRSVPASG